MSHLRPAPLTRLSQANPRISGNRLHFDCPFHSVHPEWGQCDLSVPLVPEEHGWNVTDRDDFEKITLTPSIKVTSEAAQCFWHGFITAGSFVHCGDSR